MSKYISQAVTVDRASSAHVGANSASSQAVVVNVESSMGEYSIIASLSSNRIILYNNGASKVVGYVDMVMV